LLSAADGADEAARRLSGVGFMLAFVILAPTMDMFAKLAAGAGSPPAQVTLARFWLQVALLAPFLALSGALRLPAPSALRRHALRGGLMATATTFFFTAVAAMPLADALAIFFVAPLILTMLSGLLLGEPVGWRRWTACAVGLCGALVVIRPGFAAFGSVALAPLGAALCFSTAVALTRRDSAAFGPLAMLFWSALAGGLLMLTAMALGWAAGVAVLSPVAPGGAMAGWLLMVGVCATVAHLAITVAFSRAPAGALAPLQYLEIATAVTLGYLVFGDWPGGPTWAGLALIVGAGGYVIARERALARAPRAPARR